MQPNRRWLHVQIGDYFWKARKNAESKLTRKVVAEHFECADQFIYSFETGRGALPHNWLPDLIHLYNLKEADVHRHLLKIQSKYLEAEIKGKVLKHKICS